MHDPHAEPGGGVDPDAGSWVARHNIYGGPCFCDQYFSRELPCPDCGDL